MDYVRVKRPACPNDLCIWTKSYDALVGRVALIVTRNFNKHPDHYWVKMLDDAKEMCLHSSMFEWAELRVGDACYDDFGRKVRILGLRHYTADVLELTGSRVCYDTLLRHLSFEPRGFRPISQIHEVGPYGYEIAEKTKLIDALNDLSLQHVAKTNMIAQLHKSIDAYVVEIETQTNMIAQLHKSIDAYGVEIDTLRDELEVCLKLCYGENVIGMTLASAAVAKLRREYTDYKDRIALIRDREILAPRDYHGLLVFFIICIMILIVAIC
jgi:hypothetical protein